ncbi:major facilitator superfamily domain-containing protein [Aspergillus avenaceus]|uniref:Major facilitator superfamily domain-containing protein n=1 Tax=Aspergillus avenaceus TaxID=36643 RepID=A0A5N6U5F1_ASPAV|nr:major facilitator superfamily domain-containing protein [Aspergillus avenaceus]
MSSIAENNPTDNLSGDVAQQQQNNGGQSAFGASTLIVDAEKAQPHQLVYKGTVPKTIYGAIIDNPTTRAGCDVLLAAKIQALNQALQDIGMGRYQWFLFIITSVGWFLDSLWLASFTVINPAASNEAQFFFSGDKSSYLSISLFVGLTLGAATWPWMSDTLGRKWIFTSTVVLMGMGGLVGAGMPSFTGLCVIGSVIGLAVAGNQLVVAPYLLEFVPTSHQFLLCLQGVFWGLGQLVASAVGWAFIAEYTCGTGPDEVSTAQAMGHSKQVSTHSGGGSGSSSCHYVSNKGWRYVWWTFGCITLFLYLCRFTFPLCETPKHLLARRRDAEAVQIIKDVATYNKRQTWLTERDFARIDSTIDSRAITPRTSNRISTLLLPLGPAGFAVLGFLWAIAGLTFTLHNTYLNNYLELYGVSSITPTTVATDYLFSRYLYVAICAIPGPLVATVLIETQLLGRKRTGAIVAVLTGLSMLLATLARSRDTLLAFECVLSFLEYAGLAIMTTYTVEAFPTFIRGSGLGVMGCAWGLFGLIGHIVTAFAGNAVAGGGPVWFCGAIWIVMAGAWLVLPLETRGVAAA